MTLSHKYDYAVIGGGAAGLSFICHLIDQGGLDNGQRLLLVDPEIKKGHDHTWSWWEREPGFFDHLVYKSWERLSVKDDRYSLDLPLDKYRYKLIRSTEFYAHCNQLIADHPAVERLQAKASNITQEEDSLRFEADGQVYEAQWGFSSLAPVLDFRRLKSPYLDQHFRGWFVKTDQSAFDSGLATPMDFRTEQEGETRFFYVLPFSEDQALIEMAIFSNDIWTADRYDAALKDYTERYWAKAGTYQIEYTEQGVIPMTTHRFPSHDVRLIYIGIAGGHARASTGYTFFNIQRQVKALAEQLVKQGRISKVKAVWPIRHRMYDATLLRILQEGRMPGSQVFTDLFRENPTERLLAFLNGESTISQELSLMSSTRIRTFAAGFFREVVR